MHNTASHEAGAKNKVFGPSFLPLFTGVRGRQILGSSHTRGSKKFTLGVGLLLYHRFGRLRSGYGVCMPMHDLPLTLLRAKDHRGPQSKRGYILPSAYLGLSLIYHNYVGSSGVTCFSTISTLTSSPSRLVDAACSE